MKGFRMVGWAAMAVAFAFLPGCGGGGTELTVDRKTPPEAMVDAANLDGVRSGLVEGRLAIQNLDTRDQFNLHMAAGFDRRDNEVLPPFYFAVGDSGQRNGRAFEFNGRLFLQPTQVSLIYGPAFRELGYQPDAAEFEKFRHRLEKAQGKGGLGDATACLDAARGAQLDSLVRNPTRKGSLSSLDGTHLFLVAGEIEVPALLHLMVQLAQDPGCGAQMKALGLPSPAELDAAASAPKHRVKEGKVTLGVDRHGLVRLLEFGLTFEDAQGDEVKVTADCTIREVNKPVEIEGSPHPRPLAELLRKFGVEPQAVTRATGADLLIGLIEGFRGGITGRLP